MSFMCVARSQTRKRRPEVNHRDRAGVEYGLAPPDIYWFPLRPSFKDECSSIFSLSTIERFLDTPCDIGCSRQPEPGRRSVA